MTDKENKLTLKNDLTEFLLYTTPEGEVKVEIFLHDETIWLTQKAIGNLFGKSKATISEHLKKINAEEELNQDSTVRNFRTVQIEGSREVERKLEYYNLDAKTSKPPSNNSRASKRSWERLYDHYCISGSLFAAELHQGHAGFGFELTAEKVDRTVP